MPRSLANAPCEHTLAQPAAGTDPVRTKHVLLGRPRFGEAVEEGSLKGTVSATFGDRVTHASRTPVHFEPSPVPEVVPPRASFENHKRTSIMDKNVSPTAGRK